jgi:hypothetical protein
MVAAFAMVNLRLASGYPRSVPQKHASRANGPATWSGVIAKNAGKVNP